MFDLVKRGFAITNDNGNSIISDEQLVWILNIDETFLVMDGSKCKCGGQPEGKINNQVKCVDNHDYRRYSSQQSNSVALPIFYMIKKQRTQRVNVNSVALCPKVK